jgi:three-Cys-motif partner protein
MKNEHIFGGKWTDIKLDIIKKYLHAYTQIMSKKNFSYAYIDAFAGTGHRREDEIENEQKGLFEDCSSLTKSKPGSARIALEVQPSFLKYIFIEKKRAYIRELYNLQSEFPDRSIQIINEEANEYLMDICQNRKWSKHRAVVFLDPYGMQVRWQTYEAIAKTKAIDLWILFPIGMAIMRLLKKDGKIDKAMRSRLNDVFGTSDWYRKFYRRRTEETFWGVEKYLEKCCDFNGIGKYFVDRLKTVFPAVVDVPYSLYNSKNVPLFILCFAASNPDAGELAVKIADGILRKAR